MDFRQLLGRTPVEEIDARGALANQQAGSVLIDVREPHEYEAGHAPGAELMPLGQLGSQLSALPRDREVLFICRSGNRSGLAAQIATAAGVKAKNVRGGMIAWNSAGLPRMTGPQTGSVDTRSRMNGNGDGRDEEAA